MTLEAEKKNKFCCYLFMSGMKVITEAIIYGSWL